MRARIVDVSEGGLCLISPVWLKPKQPVEIEIDIPGAGPSKVLAEIWHIRREKSRTSNNKVWIIGAMLQEADERYDRLLLSVGLISNDDLNKSAGEDTTGAQRGAVDAAASLGGSTTPSRVSPPRTDFEKTSQGTGDAEKVSDDVDSLEPRVFRIRCKARGGPRSRVLTLAAESAEQAAMLATRDLGETWTVLEVREA